MRCWFRDDPENILGVSRKAHARPQAGFLPVIFETWALLFCRIRAKGRRSAETPAKIAARPHHLGDLCGVCRIRIAVRERIQA